MNAKGRLEEKGHRRHCSWMREVRIVTTQINQIVLQECHLGLFKSWAKSGHFASYVDMLVSSELTT